jgi:hypothetical protein
LDYARLNKKYDCAQFLINHGGKTATEIKTRAAITIQSKWRKIKGLVLIFQNKMEEKVENKVEDDKAEIIVENAKRKQQFMTLPRFNNEEALKNLPDMNTSFTLQRTDKKVEVK